MNVLDQTPPNTSSQHLQKLDIQLKAQEEANKQKSAQMNALRQLKIHKILNKVSQANKLTAFKQIMLVSRLKSYEIKLRVEQEKIKNDFANILYQKDQELAALEVQKQDQNLNINALKAKETDISHQIRSKDTFIAQLEQDLEAKRQKKQLTGENPQQSVKLLEKRLKDLEIENADLREKTSATEENLSFFIKEMGDLLDQHEQSIGNEDNNQFLNNSNSHQVYNTIQQYQLAAAAHHLQHDLIQKQQQQSDYQHEHSSDVNQLVGKNSSASAAQVQKLNSANGKTKAATGTNPTTTNQRTQHQQNQGPRGPQQRNH